jgi:hypothetical protein
MRSPTASTALARATWRLMSRLDSPVTLAVSAANLAWFCGRSLCAVAGWVGQVVPPTGFIASQICFLRLMAAERKAGRRVYSMRQTRTRDSSTLRTAKFLVPFSRSR